MPYGLVPLIASILLGLYFVLLDETTRRSQVSVAAVVIVALVVGWRSPRWSYVATLLQVAVSIYVLVPLRLDRAGR